MDLWRNRSIIIICTGQVMCYFPVKIKNKRFVPTKKNGYEPPVCTDERLRYIEVECGYCFECRKKKRNAWRVRNFEQLSETPIYEGGFSSEIIFQEVISNSATEN